MHKEITSFTYTHLHPKQSLFHFMIIATSTNSWVRNLNEFGITEKSLYNMNQQDILFIINSFQ